MGRGLDHRGSVNNIPVFARRFVLGRLEGFEKDFNICLKPTPLKNGSGNTHAYFPALGACCGTLEYLTALHIGRIRNIGWQQVAVWAEQYLPQPDYNSDIVRVLIEAFRHPIAHRGIASGIWEDENNGPGHGRRITWKVLANAKRPSIRIVPENGELKKDPPWPCSYSHRVHIHLKSLKLDIVRGANQYLSELEQNNGLQDHFVSCMRRLYPV